MVEEAYRRYVDMEGSFSVFPATPGASSRRGLEEARVQDDIWTDEPDPAERKKRQNRLHQRAWRRRQALQANTRNNLDSVSQVNPRIGTPDNNEVPAVQQLVMDHLAGRQRVPVSWDRPETRAAFWSLLEQTLSEPESLFAYFGELRAHRKREIASIFSANLSESASHQLASEIQDPNRASMNTMSALVRYFRLPQGDIAAQQGPAFPLQIPMSLDHQLFVLIQHNSIRGALTNMAIILRLQNRRFTGWDDFYTEDLQVPDTVPHALQATDLQRLIPHESWIDVVPYPDMRDNILKHIESVDQDELCDDYLGGMYEGLSEVESRGLILWGDPWSLDGWEVSEGFARKWSFLLEGCEDLMRSTNRWREARGEEKLVVEVS